MRQLARTRLLDPILDPKVFPVLFVLGAVLLSVVGNATYDMLKAGLNGDKITSNSAPYVFGLGLGLLLLLLLSVSLSNFLRRLLGRRLQVDEVLPRRGLVVLVSQGELNKIPALAAIHHHQSQLAHCWLIAPPKPAKEPKQREDANPNDPPVQSSGKNAEDLVTMFAAAAFKVHLVNRIADKTVDADDPESVFQAVEAAYAQAAALRLPGKELIADITGGTKAMTAAMTLACAKADRDMEYLLPRNKDDLGRADPTSGSVPKLLNLRVQLN